MIANSGHDERGKYSGGSAGDQTGSEWSVINWYSRPWKCILRYQTESVGEKIADFARKAANNNKIGYDQGQRLTFWNELAKVGYDPSKITNKCEADCSSGVSSIVKAVGYSLGINALKNISHTNTTYTMRSTFKSAGFTVLTDTKYLTSDKYLLPGDILLNDSHHTAINLDRGSALPKKNTDPVGWIKDNVGWWYRYADGSYPVSKWIKVDGKEYCFDSKGYLLTDQYIKSSDYKNNKKIYYVDSSGAWNNYTYKWMKNETGWWMSKEGTGDYLKNQWAYIDKMWYYFDSRGYIIQNQTATINGKKYTFNADGVWVS